MMKRIGAVCGATISGALLIASPVYAGAKGAPTTDAAKAGGAKAPAKTFSSEDAKRLYEAGLKHLDGNEGERAFKEFDAALAANDAEKLDDLADAGNGWALLHRAQARLSSQDF